VLDLRGAKFVRKSIRRFVEVFFQQSKNSTFDKNSHFDYKYFFKRFSQILTFDARYSARKGLDETSQFSRTYQNTMGSMLEHYCDITFDV